MMKASSILFVAFFAAAAATSVQAQCGNCQPGVKAGYTPGSSMTVYLDSSLSNNESNAASGAVAAWNQWFVQQGYAPPYTFTTNPSLANVTFKEDPQLHNTGIGATATNGTITTNPDYNGRTDGFLPQVFAHEFGHTMGFTDVTISTCLGQTIMYGAISVGGPYTTSPTSTDTCTLAQYNAPPPPDGGGDGCEGGRVLNIAPDCSPIVINFESGNYRLTGRNSPVLFDMPGHGHPQLMGWTAAGADEAFLWLDHNHNGKVTSGAELFGNFTPLRNGRMAINGFEALAESDANHDGVIDDLDPIWPQLMLWRDLNHNGISEPNEISRLDDSDVTAIDLHDHWAGKHDQWGNAFRYESLVSIRNKSGHGEHKHPVYDIFFVSMSP
jgi:hypothetical protein